LCTPGPSRSVKIREKTAAATISLSNNGHRRSRRAGIAGPFLLLRLLLPNRDDFDDFHLLPIERLEDVCNNAVVALDDDFVTALDLVTAQWAKLLRGAVKSLTGAVAGDKVA
jgi:predicted component of type VI protein secretion system